MSTIRVRIKVAVWPDGDWTAYGDESGDKHDTLLILTETRGPPVASHWVTAEIPLPRDVEGRVEAA